MGEGEEGEALLRVRATLREPARTQLGPLAPSRASPPYLPPFFPPGEIDPHVAPGSSWRRGRRNECGSCGTRHEGRSGLCLRVTQCPKSRRSTKGDTCSKCPVSSLI